MRRFRLWLAKLIAPNPKNNPLNQLLAERDEPSRTKSGVDFNIKEASNGYVITAMDWDRVYSNTKVVNQSEAAHIRVVSDGDNILDHIAAILAVRKLK